MKSLVVTSAQPTDTGNWLVEPITIVEARLHLKLDATGSPATHEDDDLVRAHMQTAREWCEAYTRRSFVRRTVRMAFDAFPEGGGELELWAPPVGSVTSITYLDDDGAEQTLATSVYTVDTDAAPARVCLKIDQVWPSTASLPQAVKVTYTSGYAPSTSPADYRVNIPAAIKAAMKLTIAHLYENRGDYDAGQLPAAAKALLSPYKVWSL